MLLRLFLFNCLVLLEASDDEDDDENKKGPRKSNGMDDEKDADGEKIEEEDDEDDDDSDLDDLDDDEDEYDKTLLENYNTCIDDNDEVDEFVIFKDTLQSSKFHVISVYF